MNSIILKGNITKDVDVKSYNNVLVANTSIAVKDKYAKDDKTYFFNITAFRKTAELMGEYVAKGDPLLISGYLVSENYKTETGENRTATKIIVEEMEFLRTKKDKQQQEQGTLPQDNYSEPTTITEEDVPF